ncbi:cilia- and flagella-associated protein 77 [Melanotaenia boesemani]|uniref:cilia- and flagella-associated protein 77 n=1 Tax=Melanotaenia boesemani TaxID=1250792 RepID=UPI001C057737|nr:cilia- and flagella-associated protein 77 [Melanotaenia boesemani]
MEEELVQMKDSEKQHLLSSPLGKTQSRGLTVPGLDFTYGISNRPCSDGGVAEALSSWKVQPMYEESAQSLDFVSLNREAVMAGLVTSKELRQYRVQRATEQIQAPRHCQGRTPQRPAPVPDITFGVRSREPSPISGLLSHEDGRRWLDAELRRERLTQEQTVRETPKPQHSQCVCVCEVKPGPVVETRTSLLRRGRSVPASTTPRQSRFTQVAPALDTFQDQEARLRARSSRGPQGVGTDALD